MGNKNSSNTRAERKTTVKDVPKTTVEEEKKIIVEEKPKIIVRDVRKTTEIVSDELPKRAFNGSSKEMKLTTDDNGLKVDRRSYVDLLLDKNEVSSYTGIW